MVLGIGISVYGHRGKVGMCSWKPATDFRKSNNPKQRHFMTLILRDNTTVTISENFCCSRNHLSADHLDRDLQK